MYSVAHKKSTNTNTYKLKCGYIHEKDFFVAVFGELLTLFISLTRQYFTIDLYLVCHNTHTHAHMRTLTLIGRAAQVSHFPCCAAKPLNVTYTPCRRHITHNSARPAEQLRACCNGVCVGVDLVNGTAVEFVRVHACQLLINIVTHNKLRFGVERKGCSDIGHRNDVVSCECNECCSCSQFCVHKQW